MVKRPAVLVGLVVLATMVAGCGSVSPTSKVGEVPCGVTIKGARVLDGSGRSVYREPGHWTHPNGGPPPVVQCSGSTVWVVWLQGAAMMHQAYVGARSGDGGRTWHLVFADSFFGVTAPHQLDPYFGPWTLAGPRNAYFVGSCPACSAGTRNGTVDLFVTRDGGKSFRRYSLARLAGYGEPLALQVTGRSVTIQAKGFVRSAWRRKTVTIRVA